MNWKINAEILLIEIIVIVLGIVAISNFVAIDKNQKIIDKTDECINLQLNGIQNPACACVKETIKMMYDAGYHVSKQFKDVLKNREELYNSWVSRGQC